MSNRYFAGPPSDHFDGTRFFNPGYPSTDRTLVDLLRWRFGGTRHAWAEPETGIRSVPTKTVAGISVTMVGHASVLIQVAGRNLLADPVWSDRASPFPWVGPRRVNAPGVAFEDLPPIDAVLLTHNHYDHLDMPTLRRLWANHAPRIFAPLGNDAVVAREAPEIAVETMDWYQSIVLNGGITIWLHPANHWSSRWIADRRNALWGGFVIQTGVGTIYLAGDTGYGDGRIFRDVHSRYGAPDLAILPIGAYEPRWFMTDQHVDPSEAVQIMRDCGAEQALGVHWGTFQLTDEPRLAPKDALRHELSRHAIPDASFIAMEPGDCWQAIPAQSVNRASVSRP